LAEKKVNQAYGGRTPNVVALAMNEFDTDAMADIKEHTQDFQTRYSPGIVCRDAGPMVEAVFGARACQRGSTFYTVSTRYERGLIIWNSRGDPATGQKTAIGATEIQAAFEKMRAAETSLVACGVKNTSRVSVLVTVYPDTGFIVADGRTTFLVDPSKTGFFVLPPGDDVSTPIGPQPKCNFDHKPADKEQNRPYPTWAVFSALVFASLAAVVAGAGVIFKTPAAL